MIEKNKIIDDMDPILLEYPFVRLDGTMTYGEYWEEKEYWGSQLNNVKNGTYKPLWEQKTRIKPK